jgi:hypothetical protein
MFSDHKNIPKSTGNKEGKMTDFSKKIRVLDTWYDVQIHPEKQHGIRVL